MIVCRIGRAALITALLVVLCLSACIPAWSIARYRAQHTFTLRPNGGIQIANANYRTYASATNAGTTRTSGPNGGIAPVIGPGPIATIPATATVTAIGHGNATINITTKQPGLISGRITVDGFASALGGPWPAIAHGDSAALVTAQGGKLLASGNIQWGPVMRAAVSGVANESRARANDPIDFQVFDLTDDLLLDARLLDIMMETTGAGAMSWNEEGTENRLINTSDWAEFHINLPGTFTAQAGTLDIVVSGGNVVTSSATGMFSGVALPGVGSSGAFDVYLNADLGLDYDLNPGFSDDNVLVVGKLHGSGFGDEAADQVPEPFALALALPGLLGIAGLTRLRLRRA